MSQLAFDLTPATAAVAVGDRVRVRPSWSVSMTDARPGMVGTVTCVRPSRIPCLNGGYWTCAPVLVAIDDLGGMDYGFEHEDLEVVA